MHFHRPFEEEVVTCRTCRGSPALTADSVFFSGFLSGRFFPGSEPLPLGLVQVCPPSTPRSEGRAAGGAAAGAGRADDVKGRAGPAAARRRAGADGGAREVVEAAGEWASAEFRAPPGARGGRRVPIACAPSGGTGAGAGLGVPLRARGDAVGAPSFVRRRLARVWGGQRQQRGETRARNL